MTREQRKRRELKRQLRVELGDLESRSQSLHQMIREARPTSAEAERKLDLRPGTPEEGTMTEAEIRRRDILYALETKVESLAEVAKSETDLPLSAWRSRLDAIKSNVEDLDEVLREMRFSGRHA